LEVVFKPLWPYMKKPKIVRCPDGHFCHAIFSLGPYIADYPEQVWLAGVVSQWCPKYVLTTSLLHCSTTFLGVMHFPPTLMAQEVIDTCT
jgi:hypothetical protein